MFSLRHMVIATSTAIALTGTLTGGATAAPAPEPISAEVAQHQVPTFSVDQALAEIAKARAAATVTPGDTTAILDSQISRIDTALEDAESASMQAAEDFANVEEEVSGAGSAAQLTVLTGTALASLSTPAANSTLKQAGIGASKARAASESAMTALDKKRAELLKASAKLNNTSVATEAKRVEKVREAANDTAMTKLLADSEASVPDLEAAADVSPNVAATAVAAGISGTSAGAAAMSAPAAVDVSTKVSAKAKAAAAKKRAARITKTVAWAKKVAKNNKYKYRYGGTGPTYFDCSGYIGKAFTAGGKKLKRTSSQQYKASPTKVKLSKMKKGDLVFWSSNSGRSFYHVALYLGSGNIAHARNPKAGISVTKLNYAGTRNIYKYGGRY